MLEGILSGHEELDGSTAVTVETLNSSISEVLAASDGLYFDYVVGDVSDYREANGNAHFDLTHDGNSIHSVLLGYRRDWVDAELEDDLQVAVSGDLTYYEARGSCSVMVDDAIELGESEYNEIYAENRATLADDGPLDDDHKQPLPEHPETVGLVTSLDSDAREDAVTSIHARHPDVDIIVQHATVQGDAAMTEMMEAISVLDRDSAVDVLVLTRGGGADTTLRVFNETPLCRVIFNTETPVVVGIGHERDRTLAEEVADRRVMTPTHAGEVVPEKQTLEQELRDATARLEDTFSRHATAELDRAQEDLERVYTSHTERVLTRTETGLEAAFETQASQELTELGNRLEYAYDALEQAEAHEQAKEAAVEEAVQATQEEAEAAVQAKYERRQRLQRAAIALLVAVLLLLLAYIILA
ncbi:exodeoxyribonuclease VII large subunit [Halorubellus litoreus]|uniref:Exodeoxyribonuclease VII large subunit n=1 Tax=Halorubellus litoreus TaxID=755308 RepID=A0ABD5VKF4_9EURY